MRPNRSFQLLTPLLRSLAQLDDPVFLGVAARSVGWSVMCFAMLYAFVLWVIHRLLNLHGMLGGLADLLGSVGAALLALWLFLPVAAVIGTFYFDRIAVAVERRFYPGLAPPQGAPLLDQVWDGVSVGLRVLVLNVFALVLTLLLPGIGMVLGWMITAFAIGRGLFVAVAMRRMPRKMAESLYRSRRGIVLAQSAILTVVAYTPILNLLVPVLGVAAMIHVLDSAIRC